jgi:class 3 adenylate cyclase
MSNFFRKEFRYHWAWQLQSSPEELWSLVTDTNRFNRDSGVPAIEPRATQTDHMVNARRSLRLYRLGVRVDYEEEPFEWIYPRRYGVKRYYHSGPVASMRVNVQLQPQLNGGTQLIYEVRAQARNLLGLIAIPLQIGWLSARSFDKTFRAYDHVITTRQSLFTAAGPAHFPAGGRERLATFTKNLLEQGATPEHVNTLSQFIEQADDFILARIRPYQLADEWGYPRRAVLELCLWATRVGLLNFQWEVLCPLCRGAKQESATLSDIKAKVHCDTCNIDFTANFERSVELTFHPNPAVRHYETREFCMGGPQLTPHIVAQQLLPAHSQRAVSLQLEPGRYRIRTLELAGSQALLAAASGAHELTIHVNRNGWLNDEPSIGLAATLQLDNATDSEQLFILERTKWSDQAATAAEVTALQVFRDLFANEALRPGDQFSVGSLTILFTDLRGSTSLYREVGDATAFGYVMSHFDVLRLAIANEDGAIVKTIGDAVMGVFRNPASALRAIIHAQQELMRPTPNRQPLTLKAGLHYGPCVAVTLNGRLDYFGSTVNIAARLEGFSSGDDVIVSAAVRDDPEVAKLLDERTGCWRAEPFESKLKGFGEENFMLYRIAAKTQ